MNWLEKVFCGGCPETKEVVVEKIVEVVKYVPVAFDEGKYEDAAKALRTAYDRAVKAEKKCIELGMSVRYAEKNPKPDRGYLGYTYYGIGSLDKHNLLISNVIRKDFNEVKRG